MHEKWEHFLQVHPSLEKKSWIRHWKVATDAEEEKVHLHKMMGGSCICLKLSKVGGESSRGRHFHKWVTPRKRIGNVVINYTPWFSLVELLDVLFTDCRSLMVQKLTGNPACFPGNWTIKENPHSKKKKYFRAPFLVLQVVTNRGLYSVPGRTK